MCWEEYTLVNCRRLSGSGAIPCDPAVEALQLLVYHCRCFVTALGGSTRVYVKDSR